VTAARAPEPAAKKTRGSGARSREAAGVPRAQSAGPVAEHLEPPPVGWHRFTAGYARALSWLLVATVGILVIPVTLQIFARYTPLIPTYIWTEELARFMFIWSIMVGAMIGVRESTHFVVDLWPLRPPRAAAALDLVGRLATLVFAIVFLWYGIEFTQFAWGRISELAELPLWLIHVAWPLAGATWLVFAGEHLLRDLQVLVRGHA
jgi:TRAP-type C4-dicarboxylate transport system permease small subunit